MSSPKPIRRIQSPSAQRFEKEHLRRLQPVVLRGLFAGQAVDRLRTRARALSALGDMKLDLQEQYFGPIRRKEKRRIVHSTLRRYLSGKGREASLVCVEQSIPSELQALVRIPEYCRYRYRADGQDGITSRIFIAHEGEVAHLHFDTDFNHVLLHQVFGRKRVILFSPELSRLFNPILNVGSLAPEEMDVATKERFIAAFAAYDFVLRPGETAYIPPLMWHHIEYVDTGMSFNLRFGRGPESGLFDRIHPSWKLQRLVWDWLKAGSPKPEGQRLYTRLRRAFERVRHDGMDAYHAMEAELTKLCREDGAEDLQHMEYWIPPEGQIAAEIAQRVEIGELYSKKVPKLPPLER